MSRAAVTELISQPRVTPRLAPALGGLLRLTWSRQFSWRKTMTGLALLAGLGGITYLMAANSHPGAWEDWIGRAFLTAIVPVLAFMAGAGAVRDDLKPGAVDYMMTRPLPRWAYVLFKYIAEATFVLAAGLLALGLMLAIGAARDVVELPVGSLLGGLVGGVLAFLALGFMSGALTSRYMIFGLLYAGLVEAAVGSIPIQLNQLSILRHLRVFLEGGGSPVVSAGWLTLITLTLVGIAMAIFAMKEFIGEKGGDA